MEILFYTPYGVVYVYISCSSRLYIDAGHSPRQECRPLRRFLNPLIQVKPSIWHSPDMCAIESTPRRLFRMASAGRMGELTEQRSVV